jgi:hypothetical protein
MNTSFKNTTEKAVKAAGRLSTVARMFNFKTAQAVANWIERDKVPDVHVIRLCKLGEWQVTPHELRPDIYPTPSDGIPDNIVPIQQESD